MLDHLSPFWVNPICVVDFESTSADPNECLPVQVGAVLFAGSDTREFCTMIDPGVAIPVEASAIHGIKDEDVQGMPSPEGATGPMFPPCRGLMLWATRSSKSTRRNCSGNTGVIP
jgi:DNA polymerase III epsilon subunit-like protein